MTNTREKSRRRYLQALAAAGVVGVAGCANEEPDTADDGGQAETPTDDGASDGGATDDGGEPTDTDDKGTDTESEGPLTTGHIAPLAAVLGVGSQRAAELATAQVNSTGGVMDQDIELLTRDTLVSAAEGQRVVEELVTEENADVIVGTFQAEVARAVADLTSDFGVPFISTGPAQSDLTTDFVGDDYDRYKHYFRVGPVNTALQAESIADYLTYLSDRHGWNSLTFYRDQAAWTQEFGDRLPDLLSEVGLTIEAQQAITIQDPDLSPVVSATEEEGVDYMLRFFAHISSSPQQIYPEWRGNQLEFGIEGIHIPGTHPEYDIAVEGRNIFETTAQYGGGGPTPLTDNTQPFVEEYIGEYAGDSFDIGTPDGSPMEMGFATYDAIVLVADVLNEIGTTEPVDNLDAYVDEMLGTEPGRIESVSGPISFYGPDQQYPHDLRAQRNASGEITNFPVTQFQPYSGGNVGTVEYDGIDRPGQVECVYPEPHRTADHQQPSWMA